MYNFNGTEFKTVWRFFLLKKKKSERNMETNKKYFRLSKCETFFTLNFNN